MTIVKIAEEECRLVLGRGSVGRLGCCLKNEPYIVPICYAFEAGDIYVFSTFGQKVEWMRANPSVCVQVDEIVNPVQWVSVIANGTYEELQDSDDSDDRSHARKLLEKQHQWWVNALAERRSQVDDLQVAPLFFRIRATSITGLRATVEIA